MGRERSYFATIPDIKDVTKAPLERKMKFSSILDQGDESEFVISTEEQKQRWLENFVRQTGGLPWNRRNLQQNRCLRF